MALTDDDRNVLVAEVVSRANRGGISFADLAAGLVAAVEKIVEERERAAWDAGAKYRAYHGDILSVVLEANPHG